MTISAVRKQILYKTLKNRRKYEKRRIRPKYRAHHFGNSFIALPVHENPMVEKIILNLSPIGKKLGGPPETYGRHLGFWALDPTMDTKCFCGAI